MISGTCQRKILVALFPHHVNHVSTPPPPNSVLIVSAAHGSLRRARRPLPTLFIAFVTSQPREHSMGSIYDPVRSCQLASHDPPFHWSMPRLPSPNFYYTLEDLVASYEPFPHLLRSPCLHHHRRFNKGHAQRSGYVGGLHSCLRHEARPFRYPGNMYTWDDFCEMMDAGVLAEQHVWVAVTAKAKNEAFNCTNGDVFTWKKMWKLLSEEFKVGFVEYKEEEEFDIVEMMRKKSHVWEELVKKQGLYKTKAEETDGYRCQISSFRG